MKRIAYCIMFLALGLLHFKIAKGATGDITGQIIEKETMAPVAYAQVTLDNGTSKTVITANEYGHYSAHNLLTGKYQVSVKYDNHIVAMNPIHIKDSYTAGINLIVSAEPTVQIKDVKNGGTTGALKEKQVNSFDVIVKPTQAPVKAPLVKSDKKVDLLLPVNPIAIASKSPMV
jgi:carboxypeptidase family protein